MQTLLALFRTTNHIDSLSLADLSDSIARARTRGHEGPSVLWTVGHMLHSRHRVLAYLGATREDPWGSTFDETPATDGADYPSLDAMRAEWETMHARLERAFDVAAPDVLERPVDQTGIHGETRIHDKVAFLAWHEAYHTGVIGAIRTAAGLVGPADLARAAAARS